MGKRTPKELLTPEQYNAPHPNPNNSYGATYGEHREFLELSLEDHRELQEHCKSIGLEYSCSVWDTTAAKEIVTLNPILIKVGSPSNTHWEIEKYQHRVKAIGFSGHHLGIAIDIGAYALGAQWIERHFTKDRTWKGTDHAASLETAGLTKLVRDLDAMYTSLTYKKEDILDLEKEMRAKLKWGFYNKSVVEGKKQGCSSV